MLNLMLHCGARHVERREVEQAATPSRSPTWVPVPHHRLLEQVESTLLAGGLELRGEAHALWSDNLRYFGLLEVGNGQTHDDYALILGLRNSHDKSFPATIGLGSGVFVCDNLAFSAEVQITRRHTRNIERDLPRIVNTAIARLSDLRGQQEARIEAYKQSTLDSLSVHDLVIRSVDAGVLPVTQVPEVLSEWRTPSFAEFAQDGSTAWRLFNSFTEVWKGRNLLALPRRTQWLHGALDLACGLAV
jgi:hypothetical protein